MPRHASNYNKGRKRKMITKGQNNDGISREQNKLLVKISIVFTIN